MANVDVQDRRVWVLVVDDQRLMREGHRFAAEHPAGYLRQQVLYGMMEPDVAIVHRYARDICVVRYTA